MKNSYNNIEYGETKWLNVFCSSTVHTYRRKLKGQQGNPLRTIYGTQKKLH